MKSYNFKACLLLFFVMGLANLQAQTNFRGLMRKADQLFETSAFAPAVDVYRQALEKDATDPDALGRLAECYRMLNRLDEAEATYLKLIRGRKYDPRQLLLYGHCLRGLGRYDEAKVWYTTYAKTNPTLGNQFAQSCDFAKTNLNVPTTYNVINERINSTSSDFGPTFMNDQLIFSSLRTEGQTFSANRSSLYTSVMSTDGSVQSAVVVRPGISEFSIGPATYSSDGRNAATTKNNFTAGVRQIPGSGMDLSIVLADVNFNGSWYNERSYQYNDTKGKTGFPCLTPDGNALFFASDREGGFGGWDLYISYKESNTWSKPINLGPAVNTPGDEITPYFDGTNLYFSSDFHLGFGGFDVFMAEQGEGRWLKSTNLGQPINSFADDYGMIMDGYRNFGYLVSNRSGGKGLEDIYRVVKGGIPISGNNNNPGNNNNGTGFPANNTGRTRIRVFSGSDGIALPNASVDLTNCLRGSSNYILLTDAQGYIELPVGAGTECEVIVRADGYMLLRGPLSAYFSPSRDIEIPLTKAGEEYYGRVANSASREYIPNVQIAARNTYTGNSTRTSTDYSGNYVLSLARNTPYVITFAAQNYNDETRNVNVLNGGDRTLLGIVNMMPFNSNTNSTPNPPNPNPGTNTGNTNTGGSVLERPGFAIQVSSVLGQPDLSKFSNLRSFGSVYAKNEAGKNKIKVGNFPTRDEAQRQLDAVKQLYPGAFIVTDDGYSLGNNQPNPNVNPNPQPWNPSPPVVNPPVNSSGRFMIQLGAYRDPRSFNGSKLVGLGTVLDRPRVDLTVKLLCCYNSAADAFRALPQVQQAGFSGAFVVEDQNGQLVRAK